MTMPSLASITTVAGGVCTPQGFLATGGTVGLKASGKKDVALLVSQVPCQWAGVFTTNTVRAASVLRGQALYVHHNPLKACVINSGNANACTGEQGHADNETLACLTAQAVGCTPNEVMVASTGIIGVPLPMPLLEQGIPLVAQQLASTPEAGTMAAEAIRTTDTFTKEAAVQVTLPASGVSVTLGGMTKGSGMIHPNMATMLGFITTDAAITHEALHTALTTVTHASFNQISVDGDTSTNDMVVILANGLANNPLIDSPTHPDYPTFVAGLEAVAVALAKQIATDGEGATKLLEAHVQEAPCVEDARTLAKAIICSSLVKSAFFGQSANWGRILSSMGGCGVAFIPERVSMQIKASSGVVRFFENGSPCEFDVAEAKAILAEPSIVIEVFLKAGTQEGRAWGCDLTYDYVKINADYLT